MKAEAAQPHYKTLRERPRPDKVVSGSLRPVYTTEAFCVAFGPTGHTHGRLERGTSGKWIRELLSVYRSMRK